MCSPFISCGSFQNQEDGDIIDTLSPCSTPKRSRRSSSSYRNKEYKNRYANLGLDKFNALLSDLEEQKQKIYTQHGAEDIASVEFVISSDNEIKPLVFKTNDASSKATQRILQDQEKLNKNTENRESSLEKKLAVEEISKKKRGCTSLKLEKFKHPYYYLPVVVILILLSLAIYGRPFAILCTSIGWYLVALLRVGNKKSSSNGTTIQRRLKRKKEHSRRLYEKTFSRIKVNDGSSSPTSVFNGPEGISPPGLHGHRRS